MIKLVWILVICLAIIGGIYFTLTKNIDTSYNPVNNAEKIPEPPQLPE